MWRKAISALVLTAIVCSFVYLPASAVDLTIEPLVDIDFQTGEMVDKVGTAKITLEGEVTFKEDSQHGNVAVMNSPADTAGQYVIEGLDIAELKEYTIEVLVKLTNTGDLEIMSVGDDTNVNIIPLTAVTYFGAGPGRDLMIQEAVQRDTWVHIVATSDGQQQFLYFDGLLVGEEDFRVNQPFKDETTMYLGSEDFLVSMEVGFFRFYKNAATEDDVAILFEDAEYFGSDTDSDPSEEPSEEPSEAPTEEPSSEPSATEEAEATAAPAATASPRPTASAAPEDDSSGGLSTPVIITLVVVLVILVAGVVVLVIVLKKRKK